MDFSRLAPSWHWVAFLAAGVSSPALSLLFMYRSIHRLGVAPTNSIANTHAFFGPFLALFLLGERPHPAVWVGIALVTAGVYLLTGGADLRERRRYVVLPLLAAFFFGLAHNLRKIGFGGTDSLLFGGFLQGTSAVAISPLVLKVASRGRPFVFAPRAVRFFFLAGLAQALAQLTLLYALRGGRVSLIGPILATAPLFALLLTHLMLRGKEEVGPRVAAGACLVVLGVILVTTIR